MSLKCRFCDKKNDTYNYVCIYTDLYLQSFLYEYLFNIVKIHLIIYEY